MMIFSTLLFVIYFQTVTFAGSKCMFIVLNQKKSEILMNKAELINAIAAESGLSKADAKKALDATVKAVSETLVAGDKVSLVGFGTFSVSERAARQGINPATKQTITIGAKKVAKFKPGAELNASIN
jgi:DNA-binding protein HU-beta